MHYSIGSAPTDVAILGGSSAGSVLATRPSEDPERQALLVEVGPDIPPDALPPPIASPYPGRVLFNREWLWTKLRAVMGIGTGNQAAEVRPHEQARILGGVWHPSGTCRMGAARDRMAVVAPDARLRGVGGLGSAMVPSCRAFPASALTCRS